MHLCFILRSKIKTKIVLTDKNKKSLSDAHAKKIRYISSDSDVATVDKKGVITAKKAGTCYLLLIPKLSKVKITSTQVK